jgi:hypothetical protein
VRPSANGDAVSERTRRSPRAKHQRVRSSARGARTEACARHVTPAAGILTGCAANSEQAHEDTTGAAEATFGSAFALQGGRGSKSKRAVLRARVDIDRRVHRGGVLGQRLPRGGPRVEILHRSPTLGAVERQPRESGVFHAANAQQIVRHRRCVTAAPDRAIRRPRYATGGHDQQTFEQGRTSPADRRCRLAFCGLASRELSTRAECSSMSPRGPRGRRTADAGRRVTGGCVESDCPADNEGDGPRVECSRVMRGPIQSLSISTRSRLLVSVNAY